MEHTVVDTVWGPHVVPVNDYNVAYALMRYGEFSIHQAVCLYRLIKPGDTVVDIGANIGAMALPMMLAAGTTGRVVCFEPQAEMARMLEATLAANAEDGRYTVHVCGLGREASTLYLSPINYDAPVTNFGCVHLVPEGDIAVPVAALDDFPFESLSVIKIDAEGMEPEIIAGAERTIRQHKPIMMVENDRQGEYMALIAQIEALGYECYWFVTPLFNPKNSKGDTKDIYLPHSASVDILCFPQGMPMPDYLTKLPRATAEWAKRLNFITKR